MTSKISYFDIMSCNHWFLNGEGRMNVVCIAGVSVFSAPAPEVSPAHPSLLIPETDDVIMRFSRTFLKSHVWTNFKVRPEPPYQRRETLNEDLHQKNKKKTAFLPALKVKTTTKEMLMDSRRKRPTHALTTINGAQSLRWRCSWLITSPCPYTLPLLSHQLLLHVCKHQPWPPLRRCLSSCLALRRTAGGGEKESDLL